MLRNLNKFNFPYYSCKRIAKPYPNGPVDQRDSFRVQLCDNFILDIANFHRRLNARSFSFCAVKLNQSFSCFSMEEIYQAHTVFCSEIRELYRLYGSSVIVAKAQTLLQHMLSSVVFQYFSLYSICSHTGFYAFNILS